MLRSSKTVLVHGEIGVEIDDDTSYCVILIYCWYIPDVTVFFNFIDVINVGKILAHITCMIILVGKWFFILMSYYMVYRIF